MINNLLAIKMQNMVSITSHDNVNNNNHNVEIVNLLTIYTKMH